MDVDIAWAEPLPGERFRHLLGPDPWRGTPADVDRHLSAHALARLTIATLINVDPAALRFVATCRACGGPHGRPVVADHPTSQFSLSHKGDRVVVAVVRGAAVGVDVERAADCGFDGFDDVALSAAERRAVTAATTPADRATIWSRKEAVLKATGHGLLIAPTTLQVTPPDDEPALLDWAVADRPPHVQLADLDLGAGYAGAVAVLTDQPVRVAVTDCRARLEAAAAGARRATP